MKVVGIDEGTDLLKQLPDPPTYLGAKAKSHFKRIGKILIAHDLLKNIHVPALEIFAENFEQWEWSVREIRKKNRKQYGSGYIQTYKSGAENISVEVTLKRDAEKAIMQCIKQFGLDPKSEKDLGKGMDPAQLDMFEEFLQRKKTS